MIPAPVFTGASAGWTVRPAWHGREDRVSQPALEEQLEPAPADSVAAARARSSWELFRSRFMQDKAAVAGAIVIVILIALALAAPLFGRLTGHGPNELFDEMRDPVFGLPKGPNAEFWFGADSVGRDLFVRVMYGARTSLTAEGCLGGLLRPGLSLVIGIIVIFTWPNMARLVRGQVLSLREREFVDAARSLGARPGRIMFRELLPNLVAPIVVYATLIIPNNIIFEAALSFLGVGVPQTTPSWGRMLAEVASGQLFTVAWWMMVFPGVFLLLTTLSFNLVGDGLRDALGPSERS